MVPTGGRGFFKSNIRITDVKERLQDYQSINVLFTKIIAEKFLNLRK